MILLDVEADSSFHREVFAVLLVAIQFMPLAIGAAVPLLNPKGAASKNANLLKDEHDAIDRIVGSGDHLEGVNEDMKGIDSAKKEVGSTAKEVADAAKSFASWARAKMRGGGAATKHQGSPTSPISRDAPPYDEEHAGPSKPH